MYDAIKILFTDIGVPNAILNFPQLEETHIMGNIIYNDSFKKIIIVKDDIKLKRNEEGIVTIGLFDFLLNNDSLNW